MIRDERGTHQLVHGRLVVFPGQALLPLSRKVGRGCHLRFDRAGADSDRGILQRRRHPARN